MKLAFCVLIVAVLALFAAETADITGKWTGSFKVKTPSGETNDSTAVLLLKQTGSDITGSAGPTESEQHPISKGKIEGNKITLELADENRIMKFALVLADERITGDVSMTRDGESRTAKIDVTRVK